MEKLGVFKDFSDGSLKSVFDIGEHKIIEMTLLANKKDMDVVCVPTHHYCNLGCKMCHLTNNDINKKMIPIDSKDFFNCFIETLLRNGVKRTNKKKLLISFMGVGEPLLNLKLVSDIYEMEDILKECLGYESVGYAISTMMPNKNILKLIEMVNQKGIPLKVHFSLHTPIDEKRFYLIPKTKVKVEEAFYYLKLYRDSFLENNEVVREYKKLHRTSDPVELHYTLINGVNDSREELYTLIHLLDKYRIPIKFIRFNPKGNMKKSSKEEEWVFSILLNVSNLRIKTYSPPGKEIGSSCGEFTKHYYLEEIETEEQKREFDMWKRKHQIFEKENDDLVEKGLILK